MTWVYCSHCKQWFRLKEIHTTMGSCPFCGNAFTK